MENKTPSEFGFTSKRLGKKTLKDRLLVFVLGIVWIIIAFFFVFPLTENFILRIILLAPGFFLILRELYLHYFLDKKKWRSMI